MDKKAQDSKLKVMAYPTKFLSSKYLKPTNIGSSKVRRLEISIGSQGKLGQCQNVADS